MSGPTNLILIGALVGVLVVARKVVLHWGDLNDIPCYMLRRIEAGSRVAPWLGVAAVTAVLVGLVLTVCPGS